MVNDVTILISLLAPRQTALARSFNTKQPALGESVHADPANHHEFW